MAALTRACPRDYEDGELNNLQVAASTIIYEGSAVGINSDGYLRPIEVGHIFAGFALNDVDNSGGNDGDLSIQVVAAGRIILPILGVTYEKVNAAVYASDENTFTLDSNQAEFIGYIDKVISDGVVLLKFNSADGGIFELSQQVFVSKKGSDTLGEIGKTNRPFLTIQAANDAITDSATDKRYLINASPGRYAENITLSNYVYFKGANASTVVINPESGDAFTMPSIASAVTFCTIELSPTSNLDNAFAASGGNHLTSNIFITCSSSDDGRAVNLFNINCLSFGIFDSTIIYNMSGSSAGPVNHELFKTQGSTISTLSRLAISMTVADVDDNIVCIGDTSTGNTIIVDTDMLVTASNGSFAGNAIGFAVYGAANIKQISNSQIICVGTSGTGYAVYIDSTGDNATVERINTRTSVTGFDSNYDSKIAIGDKLQSISDKINAADGSTGAGTLEQISYIDDNIICSGNIGISTSTFGTNAKGVIALKSNTPPDSSVADTVQIYSKDLTAGNTMLGLRTEGTNVGTGTPSANRTVAFELNGETYYLLASTTAL